MKRLLIAAAALTAVAGVASAQPAYDSSQGSAPADYPHCTQPGQDRCIAGAGGRHMHMNAPKAMHHHAAKPASKKTSKDGERG